MCTFQDINMDTTKKVDACNGIETKRKRRRLRVGDPDFVPPDGGWGWMIVVACGFSNVSPFIARNNHNFSQQQMHFVSVEHIPNVPTVRFSL